jgi:DNA-binding transcriptional regulator/RsmH inhibitor MraZ
VKTWIEIPVRARPEDKDNKTEIVIAGNFDDLQLWASEPWERFCGKALADFGADLEWLHCGDAPREDGAVTDESAA